MKRGRHIPELDGPVRLIHLADDLEPNITACGIRMPDSGENDRETPRVLCGWCACLGRQPTRREIAAAYDDLHKRQASPWN